MQQKIDYAKTIKLSVATKVHESRMNSNSSAGIYVTAELRASSRFISSPKELNKKEAIEQEAGAASKNESSATKKKTRFIG